ncbi:MAG: hypothetical protein LBU89_09800 [Fibromonadaceae bacterium]|jgi:DNA-binding beta-propeller fold protein YncE|nr:hypothetical protein [Fibromonadaceae bacterium]
MTQRTTLAALRRSITSLAIAFAIFACSDGNSDNTHEEIKGNSLLLNFTSDYLTGMLRWMTPDSTSLSPGIIDLGADSRVSAGGGNIFVLSSGPGVLTCILPEKINDKSTIKQSSLDAVNPYEAAVVGSKGYIASHDEDYVQVFNTSSCAPSGKIALPISNANASSIKASGDTLLVVLQRLEIFSATKPGLLVRINASTEKLIDTIPLKLYNSHSSILSKGKLYISAQARYNEDFSYDWTESGVEVVDLAKGTTEVLATGDQLGGGAYGIALDEAGQTLYVSVSANFGVAPVKSVNVLSKDIKTLPNIVASEGGVIFDNEVKKLFVGDRESGKENLKIYDPATNSTSAVNEGTNALPPYSLAIVRW